MLSVFSLLLIFNGIVWALAAGFRSFPPIPADSLPVNSVVELGDGHQWRSEWDPRRERVRWVPMKEKI